MEMNTCTFAYYVKRSCLSPACISNSEAYPSASCLCSNKKCYTTHISIFLKSCILAVELLQCASLLLCRCVCCVQCGSNSPGFHCEWQNNYTHCGPCASLVTCPVCRENFMEEELLLQCQHCDRWVLLIRTTYAQIQTLKLRYSLDCN